MTKFSHRAAATLIAGSGIASAAIGAYTGWTLNAPRRPGLPYAFTPFEVGAEAEDVRFVAADGVGISGWWFTHPDARASVILAHGHRGGKADMLGIGPGLQRAGFDVLAFDFRGNGESDDGPQSLAFHEQRDLAAAINWVCERQPQHPIAVVGFSMGAATALLTAAADPRVAAVVVDSPFATMSDVVAAAYRKYRLPSAVLLPVADAYSRLRYGYRFAQVRPLDAMTRIAPRPVLLIHGTADSVIPYEHARQLAEATPETVEFVTAEGIDHCGAYFADRPGYIARVAEFLHRALDGASPDSTGAAADAPADPDGGRHARGAAASAGPGEPAASAGPAGPADAGTE